MCWGRPEDDADMRDGAFRFRARAFGSVLVAFPPDRGRSSDRRSDYHDAILPPRHALLAFGLWLRHVAKADALVHMGAHGTLEWLPGKAVALTGSCFPELVVGSLPVIYPFIVSNPGEAAQAKRRIAAVTIGHLPPPLVAGGLSGETRELERLVDEYAQADGLDRRRRERLARLILEHAEQTGLASEARVRSDDNPDDALRRIDAWLCDLKDLAVKDGLHVYGREPLNVEDPAWQASAAAERARLFLPRWTFAGLHRARPVLRPAVVATSCRPGATCLSPIPAPCRRRLRPSSAGSPPTRSSAAICKFTARCRAPRSSTSGAARRYAPAARRSRRASH